jgi:hypothetical protein
VAVAAVEGGGGEAAALVPMAASVGGSDREMDSRRASGCRPTSDSQVRETRACCSTWGFSVLIRLPSYQDLVVLTWHFRRTSKA